MAAWNAGESANAVFFTNFRTRSIRVRFGEYGGRDTRSTRANAATARTCPP